MKVFEDGTSVLAAREPVSPSKSKLDVLPVIISRKCSVIAQFVESDVWKRSEPALRMVAVESGEPKMIGLAVTGLHVRRVR